MSNRIYYSQEAERLARRRQFTRMVVFSLLGAGIGAAVATLLSPNDGEEMRELITEALQKGYERGREATDEALSQLEGEFPNLRKKVDGLLDKVSRQI